MMVKFGSIYYAGSVLITHLCEHDNDILFTFAYKMAEFYRFIQIYLHGSSKKSIVSSPLLFSGGQSINQSIHMNIFCALRVFREMRYWPYCIVIHHRQTENTQAHYLFPYRVQSLEQVFMIFIPRWIPKRKWVNIGVNTRREGGFMDINQRKLHLLPLNLNRCTCKMVRNLSLCSVGKTEKEFVVEDVENLKTINKIVPIAVNSNSSKDQVFLVLFHVKCFKKCLDNLQAQCYKIIDSNIL